MRRKKILLLGSLPNENEPASFGGATVLFKSLKEYFDRKNINYKLILLTKYGRSSTIANYCNVLFSLLANVFNSSIIFINVSGRGFYVLVPILLTISKIFKKKVVVRLFGSNFKEVYQNEFLKLKFLVHKIISFSDVIIVETKQNISFFKDKNAKSLFQLPNVRKKRNVMVSNNFSKRFVFISHVKTSKGVDDIINAALFLDSSYTIDVYGPVMDNYNVSAFNNSNVKYKGALHPEEVINTLLNYDVVVLPTFYQGEGHPGILVEALSIGMPIIATNWSAIPDIVEDTFNGLLIPTKNPDLLAKAIRHFDEFNYPFFVKNAKEKFADFEEESRYSQLMIALEKL